MKLTHHRFRALGIMASVALLLGGLTVADATASTPDHDQASCASDSDHDSSPDTGDCARGPEDPTIANDLQQVTNRTQWALQSKLHLDFPTFHTEGMAIGAGHIFVSSVEIIEKTVKFNPPPPYGQPDRTPGVGRGHLFVMDMEGRLQKDLVFGDGNVQYHPGGIDFDGRNVWLEIGEYRPFSHATIYSVDATTLAVTKHFEVNDHIGGIVFDRQTHHLYGNTWGARRWYEWTVDGEQVSSREEPQFFIDYQDCKYIGNSLAACDGISNMTPAPGSTTQYELGGVSLVDLRTHQVLRTFPFQKWSTAGHVATRNPFWIGAQGNEVTMKFAPDNGDEGNGTEILTYTATVS